MAWGDAFKSKWDKATDSARSAAGALATGAKKVASSVKEKAEKALQWAENQAEKSADWVEKKSDEVAQWAEKKAAEVGIWAENKASQTAETVKKAYQTVKKTFKNKVAGAVKAVCAVIQKGLDGAKKERKKEKPASDLLKKFFDIVKPSGEVGVKKDYPQKMGWGSKKEADDSAKTEIKVGVSATSLEGEDRLLYYGDEHNNLQIGSGGYKFKHGVAYNPEKREYTADLIDLSAHAEVISWKTKNSLGESELVTLETKVDALAVEGKGRIGATWGPDKKEMIAEASVSVDLIKAKGAVALNITPKSIWDNTIGRFSFAGKAPKWLDHGISLGAEGEAGIGAGASGEVVLKEGRFEFGAAVGLGLKFGFKLGIGFK